MKKEPTEKTLHSCAVMRYMLMCQPEGGSKPQLHVLTGLLAFMTLSGHTKDDLKGNFFVSGSASISQISSITQYEDAAVRMHLKALQRAGYVNWVKRDHNRGADYRVWAYPQEDLIQEMQRGVDPKKSEQAKIAAGTRWARYQLDKPGSANSMLNGCAIPDAGSAILNANGALFQDAESASRIATLELGSGTVLSVTPSGTRGETPDPLRSKPSEQSNLTSFDRSRPTPTPRATPASLGVSPRTPTGTSRLGTHGTQGKTVASLQQESSAAAPSLGAEIEEMIAKGDYLGADELAVVTPDDPASRRRAAIEARRKREADEVRRMVFTPTQLRDPQDEELDRYFGRNRNAEARHSVYMTDEEGAAAELDD